MPITKRKSPAKPVEFTDEEIAAQVADNPDAAPLDLDWSLDNPKVRAVEPIDVKAIREKTGMSQGRFAKEFGLSVDSLQQWEQQRRMPRGAARTLLLIIDGAPNVVRKVLKIAAPAVVTSTPIPPKRRLIKSPIARKD